MPDGSRQCLAAAGPGQLVGNRPAAWALPLRLQPSRLRRLPSGRCRRVCCRHGTIRLLLYLHLQCFQLCLQLLAQLPLAPQAISQLLQGALLLLLHRQGREACPIKLSG